MKLALLISGGGTTATTIIQNTATGKPLHGKVEPALVIASNPDAKGIERIKATGLVKDEDIFVRRPSEYQTPVEFGEGLIAICESRQIEIFGQYGWMPKTPRNFINSGGWVGINQHPGPIRPGKRDFGGDGMYGRRVHFARLMFTRMTGREPWTEAVAQFVHPEFDQGSVIRATRVPIFKDDDVDELQQRVLPFEHQTQIDALLDVASENAQPFDNTEIVKPHERVTWQLCREMARLAYPKG